MRETQSCPKCGHPEVLFLPALSDQGDGDPASLYAVVKLHVFWGTERWGKLQAYICERCGYTELYTEDPGSIPIARVPGAKRLKKKEPRTPYR